MVRPVHILNPSSLLKTKLPFQGSHYSHSTDIARSPGAVYWTGTWHTSHGFSQTTQSNRSSALFPIRSTFQQRDNLPDVATPDDIFGAAALWHEQNRGQ